MADFPTFSQGVLSNQFSEQVLDEGDLKSKLENGSIVTRRKFSRVLTRWEVVYHDLSNSDRLTLLNFIKAYTTVGKFNWEHPIDGSKTVRFASVPKIVKSGPNTWVAQCEFEEV